MYGSLPKGPLKGLVRGARYIQAATVYSAARGARAMARASDRRRTAGGAAGSSNPSPKNFDYYFTFCWAKISIIIEKSSLFAVKSEETIRYEPQKLKFSCFLLFAVSEKNFWAALSRSDTGHLLRSPLRRGAASRRPKTAKRNFRPKIKEFFLLVFTP